MYIIEIGDGYAIELGSIPRSYRSVPRSQATKFATKDEAIEFINEVSLGVIFSEYFITKL